MKILIWHRGPVRPNIQNCINNINLLKSNFNKNYFDFDELISTYNHPLADDLYNNYKVKYFLLMEAPDNNFVKQTFEFSNIPSGACSKRVFKQFYTNKIVSEFIFNLQKYDFVIMSRMDTSFSIESSAAEWFNPNFYTTIHDKQDGFTNDQFGVAQPEIMKKAWDYIDLKNLKMFGDNAYRAEDIFDQILTLNNVSTFSMFVQKQIRPDIWIQDPMRGNIVV
jgi:hypothetical protein